MGKVLTAAAIALVAATAVLHCGCNTSGCTELRSATPRADFYSSVSDKAIALDSLQITGIGAPGDSVLVAPGERVSSVYLPMRAATNHTGWRVVYMYPSVLGTDQVADTIGIDYTRTAWFAGEDCGTMYKYDITSVTYSTNLIDTIIVADSLVTNVDVPNLKIFFRVE